MTLQHLIPALFALIAILTGWSLWDSWRGIRKGWERVNRELNQGE